MSSQRAPMNRAVTGAVSTQRAPLNSARPAIDRAVSVPSYGSIKRRTAHIKRKKMTAVPSMLFRAFSKQGLQKDMMKRQISRQNMGGGSAKLGMARGMTRGMTRQFSLGGLGLGAISEQTVEDAEAEQTVEDQQGTQGSASIVFTLWNCMLGASILSIPWAFTTSGWLGALIISGTLTMVACYTCQLIVRWSRELAKEDPTIVGSFADFPVTCEHFLGSWARPLCLITSVCLLFGALTAGSSLLSNSLFINLGVFVKASWWTPQLAALIIWLVMYPLSTCGPIELLVSMSSAGVVCVFFMFGFISLESVSSGMETEGSVAILPGMINLSGIVTMTLMAHNLALPILNNHAEPAKANRDVGFAFALAGMTVILTGVPAYFAFHNVGVNQNFTADASIFGTHFILPFVARTVVFIQMASVYPLYIMIIQCEVVALVEYMIGDNSGPKAKSGSMESIQEDEEEEDDEYQLEEKDEATQEKEDAAHESFLNKVRKMCDFGFSVTCMLVAVLYPHVGNILSLTGALGGLIYMFSLPVAVHMMALREKGQLSILSAVFHVGLVCMGFGSLVMQFV